MSMKLKTPSGYDQFMNLSDAEKEKVWASFNREIPFSETRPLNAEDRRLHRKSGRPVKGEGSKAISVTVERRLLRRADAYAERVGIRRAQLVAMALEAFIPAK